MIWLGSSCGRGEAVAGWLWLCRRGGSWAWGWLTGAGGRWWWEVPLTAGGVRGTGSAGASLSELRRGNVRLEEPIGGRCRVILWARGRLNTNVSCDRPRGGSGGAESLSPLGGSWGTSPSGPIGESSGAPSDDSRLGRGGRGGGGRSGGTLLRGKCLGVSGVPLAGGKAGLVG